MNTFFTTPANNKRRSRNVGFSHTNTDVSDDEQSNKSNKYQKQYKNSNFQMRSQRKLR